MICFNAAKRKAQAESSIDDPTISGGFQIPVLCVLKTYNFVGYEFVGVYVMYFFLL